MAITEVKDEIIEGVGVPVLATEVMPPLTPSSEAHDYSTPACILALRRIGVFSDLPEDQLEWFIDNADEMEFNAGDVVFRKDDPPDWMVIYLEGEVHARRDDTNLDDFVYIARAGDPATEISGKLPFSRMKEMTITGRAIVYTRVLLFPVSLFPQLIQRMPVLSERLVWILMDRVRESTKMDERRDKLMALGKLSAGLAHELNNPAAAARRTSDELMDRLEELRVADLNLCRHDLSHEQREFLSSLEREMIGQEAPAAVSGNALAASDREDKLIDWLEQHNVDNGWDIAPILAEMGADVEKLQQIKGVVQAEALKDVLTRLSIQITVSKLAGEIKNSVTRISDLVGAIKEYSYMDQAAVQPVDIHKGLDNTLLILKHKLKVKNITVTRDYAENLPRITAHGSLLNQVWTNLIDNATDAMANGGQLKIRTKLEPGDILIEIRDNGAGIPPEIQSRIFEPFFTTKGVSEGTGLGLDTVSRIVRKHRGNLRFESKPGDTCFQIRLPVDGKIEKSNVGT